MNEKDTYVEFSRRGNIVMVSIRWAAGVEGHQHGAVALQYFVKLEDVLNDIAEDFDERSTSVTP